MLQRCSIALAAVAVLCISAFFLFSHHHSIHHDTTELLTSYGCRCTSDVVINALDSPVITGGGQWERPTFGRIMQSSNATVAVGTGAGTGTGTNAAQINITGGDIAGTVTLTTASVVTSSAAKPLFGVTFSSPYTNTPQVQLSPYGNYNTARLAVSAMPYIYNRSTSGFWVYTNSATLAAKTAYAWSYLVIG
jgi:hypothetical protein